MNTKKSKFLNKWVVYDGIKFQSIGEGNYYLRLKDDLIKGEILGFKRQVPYVLSVGGIFITRYIADFVVKRNDGSIEVFDFKSSFTANLELFRIKKQLMLICYNVEVRVVGVKK